MAFVYTSYIVNAWDSWAVSAEGIPGYGYFEFSFLAPSGAVCGIAEAGIVEEYTKIRHGFYFEQGQYQVIELGVVKTAKAACSSATRFRVERHPDGIRYLVDGTVIRTVPETQPTIGAQIHLYGSIYAYGEKIIDAVLVNLGGEAELEVNLPGYVGFASTDTISAIAGLSLPALRINTTAEDGLAITRDLPAYIAMASTDSMAWVGASLPAMDASMSLTDHDIWLRSSLPAVVGMAATDQVCLLRAELPAISGFGEQSDIMPGRLAIDAALPAITCFSRAEDAALLTADLPAVISMMIVQDENEPADMVIMPGTLPPIIGQVGVGASNFILLKIPAPQILWLGMKDFISVNAFSLEGWMKGMQTGGWIDAEMPSLDGDMAGGGWISSAIVTGLLGEMDGSAVVVGQLLGALPGLGGDLYGGAWIDSALTLLTGEMFGISEFLGRISGMITFDGQMSGVTEYSGRIEGQLSDLRGDVIGSVFTSGFIFGPVFGISGSVSGEAPIDGRLEGEVFMLAGRVGADSVPEGDIDAVVFSLFGHLSSNLDSTPGTCVTMKYSRY